MLYKPPPPIPAPVPCAVYEPFARPPYAFIVPFVIPTYVALPPVKLDVATVLYTPPPPIPAPVPNAELAVLYPPYVFSVPDAVPFSGTVTVTPVVTSPPFNAPVAPLLYIPPPPIPAPLPYTAVPCPPSAVSVCVLVHRIVASSKLPPVISPPALALIPPPPIPAPVP